MSKEFAWPETQGQRLIHATTSLRHPLNARKTRFDLLEPFRQWLDQIEIKHHTLARFLAKVVPAQCPFERDINLWGRTVAHIPPLCKLNPFYEQVVGLRFRALCYLVDQCGEDIQSYC
ncbi:MAG: nitrogenase [Cyanothece sp. SIO1E1]|nr:nitrogenase [Cyanothece sp. SIO1E1]